MEIVGIFISILFTPLGLPFWMGIGAALGILIGFWLSRPKRNQVCKLIPEDSRGYDLDILEENANFIYCEPLETLPPQRFLKFRKGYTITQKRRFGAKFLRINRFFGREGTAYGQRMESGKVENVPLSTTLQAIWGEEDYAAMPENLRKQVEASKINITISLEADEKTPEGMKEISEENIKQEEDRQAAETFWKGKKAALQESAMNSIAMIGLGGLIILVAAIALGWIPLFKAPTPTTTAK